MIDLGKTLFVQALQPSRARPQGKDAMAGEGDAEHADLCFCPADQMDRLAEQQFDMALTTNSMQEMVPHDGSTLHRLSRLSPPAVPTATAHSFQQQSGLT